MPVTEFFRGKRVLDFDPEKGIADAKNVYRLRVDYDDDNDLMYKLDAWANDPKVGDVTSLIIGMWYPDVAEDSDQFVSKLIEIAPKMPNLTGLVWGDIDYEESEISWIENTDMGNLMMAFPKLEYFKVRGGNGLGFTGLKHDKLKKFKIETGGLGSDAIADIINAELPNLEVLNIWFGSEYYGFDGDAETIKPLIVGKAYPEMRYPFPKLKELGLCNCEVTDDLAELMADGRLMFEQITTLDLSMGTMTNRGVEALVENELVSKLKKLDLSSNFIEDSDLVDQLRAKGIKVSATGQKEPYDDDDYYVDVSE